MVSIKWLNSLGGPQPYIPVGLDEKADVTETVVQNNPQKRARVLCSYDAADATELNLTANEVRIFLRESIYHNWLTPFAGDIRHRM